MKKSALLTRKLLNFWIVSIAFIFILVSTVMIVKLKQSQHDQQQQNLSHIVSVFENLEDKQNLSEQISSSSWWQAWLSANEVTKLSINDSNNVITEFSFDVTEEENSVILNRVIDNQKLTFYVKSANNDLLTSDTWKLLFLSALIFTVLAVLGWKWLQLKLSGLDILTQRCQLIIRGEYQQALAHPPLGRPRIINRAITHLLKSFLAVKAHQGEFYEFIQNTTLMDSETGIGNRIFLENRLQLIQKDSVNNCHCTLFIFELNDIDAPDSAFNSDQTKELFNGVIESWKKILSKHDNNLITRYAEHQIALLFVEISIKDAQKVADKLLSAVNTVPTPRGVKTDNLFHMGGVYFNSASNIDAVDESISALKAAQLQGYNNWFMYDEGKINQELEQGSVRWRVLLENAVHNNDFVLYGQEVLTIEGNINHLECYVRLRQEDRLISAANFIPMAKKSGQMPAIDKLVLTQAANYLLQNPHKPALAVNLSSELLASKEFESWLVEFLANHNSVIHRLWFEISELSWSLQPELANQLCKIIQNAGGHSAMDSCGRQLLTLDTSLVSSISRVKLHRSLVRHIDKNPPQQLYVKSLIEQIRNLKLSVYVEGVEHPNELKVLKRLGVMGYQGLLSSLPTRLENVN